MTREDGTKQFDVINKAAHYNQGGIEIIDFIDANDLGFYEGNIVKYVSRHKFKNGLEDLKKAQYYLNRLIKNLTDNE